MANYRLLGTLAILVLAACASPQPEQRPSEEEAAETAEPTPRTGLAGLDGHWVGSGSTARNLARNRCGRGPLIDLTIDQGAARAVFRLTVRRGMDRRPHTEVIPLNGRIDDQGQLELSGFQSTARALLSAKEESGEGTWETRSLACHGTFRVRRKP